MKADILNRIQNKEAAFDLEQKKVALVTIDGPQRIRGLAGSGKTIILTMKAALYHMAHPNEEILYTYYTKSLFGLIKNLIERFTEILQIIESLTGKRFIYYMVGEG